MTQNKYTVLFYLDGRGIVIKGLDTSGYSENEKKQIRIKTVEKVRSLCNIVRSNDAELGYIVVPEPKQYNSSINTIHFYEE